MMRWAFLISGIVELAGAIVIYMYPELLFENTPAVVHRLYAIAATTIGILNISCYKHGPDLKIWKAAILSMMFFHAAIAMVCYSAPSSVMPAQIQACLSHLALFILFFIAYMKDLKPEKP